MRSTTRKLCAPTESRAQELCGSRGGRSGLPVPNSPYGLCGRKATFEEEEGELHTERTDVLHTDGESFEDFWYEPTNEMELTAQTHQH